MATAVDSILIVNLENQLKRLIEQNRDLEESRSELSAEEYESIKAETMEQITEFADTLDRFHKGSITDEKLSKMRKDVEAMNKAFNTKEMIHKFGQHNAQLLSEQLATINQEYKLKKITLTEMEDKKMAILSKLRDMDHNLTDEEKIFLEKQANNEIHHNLEDITPE